MNIGVGRSGMGIVLGWWGGGGPWLVGHVGCSWWFSGSWFTWRCFALEGFRFPSKWARCLGS